MPIVEFAGQSSQEDGVISANSSRLLNLYRQRVMDGGVTRYLLRPVPGQTVATDLEAVFMRRLSWIDGNMYAACGGKLFQADDAGFKFEISAIEDDENTTITGNTGKVLTCAGGNYYVWDGSTLTQPTGAAFSDFGSVETVGNYSLLTERNGRRIQWTDLAAPGTFDALNFATTESGYDKNIRGMAIAGNYWVFKERSIEVWYETGLGGVSAFQRVQGGVINRGLRSFNLAAKTPDGAFFVGEDGVAYIISGQAIEPISSPAVNAAINEFNPTHCFYYEDDGQKFCVVRFGDRPAWCFDLATGEWHERAEGRTFDAWTAVDAAKSDNGNWVTARRGGTICSLSRIQQDLGAHLHRRAVSKTLREGSRPFRVKELEFFGAFGEGGHTPYVGYTLALGDGYLGLLDYPYDMGDNGGNDTRLRYSVSRDGGNTFGRERLLNIGGRGEYQNRAIARSLGQFHRVTVRLDIAEDFEIPVFSDARLEVA